MPIVRNDFDPELAELVARVESEFGDVVKTEVLPTVLGDGGAVARFVPRHPGAAAVEVFYVEGLFTVRVGKLVREQPAPWPLERSLDWTLSVIRPIARFGVALCSVRWAFLPFRTARLQVRTAASPADLAGPVLQEWTPW